MNTPYEYIYRAPKVEGEKQPAIFLFHGLGSNEEDLIQLVDGFDQCHVFSLRGPIAHSPGYAFYTFPEEEGKPDRQIFDKVIQFSQKFIFEAVQEYGIALDQVYVVGFNQGAALTQSLAAVMGNMIRGAVVLSGFLPDFVENEYKKAEMDKMNIFIAHGEYDYVYPYSWGQASADFFERMETNVTFYSFEDGHGVTPQVLAEMHAFLQNLMPNLAN
jgi:phospholipase/carboxylesterase